MDINVCVCMKRWMFCYANRGEFNRPTGVLISHCSPRPRPTANYHWRHDETADCAVPCSRQQRCQSLQHSPILAVGYNGVHIGARSTSLRHAGRLTWVQLGLQFWLCGCLSASYASRSVESFEGRARAARIPATPSTPHCRSMQCELSCHDDRFSGRSAKGNTAELSRTHKSFSLFHGSVTWCPLA